MRKIGIIVSFLLLCGGLFAQNYLDFVENKGQWDAAIKFKSDVPAGSFVLTATGYRVLQHNVEDFERMAEFNHPVHLNQSDNKNQDNTKDVIGKEGIGILRSHAYEVKFLNANPRPTIVPDKPLQAYNNYFIGNDPSKWSTDCKTFQAVTYKNMYPGIDVRYYTSNGMLKYDIIVQPGGDISQVVVYYEGVDGLSVKNGALQIKTSVGTLQESSPYTYQLVNNTRKEVACSYDLKGNIVRYQLKGTYDKSATLVIDPSVVFISYSGSTADNWGFTATYDNLGNFYGGGLVFGTGFPATNGAYQTNFGGGTSSDNLTGCDIGILKFDPSGTQLLYATYLGGNGNEQPHSLVTDAQGNLIIAGRTNSGTSYPTPGTLKLYGAGGGYDIVVTKLNARGNAIIGSVRIGGTGSDGVNIRPNTSSPQSGAESTRRNYGDDARSEVIVDAQGNILVASVTQSTDFLTSANAFQTTRGISRPGTNGRYQDGVILKLNNNLSSVIFSSLLGGNDDDAAFVLAINPANGNIFVAGASASTDLPASGNAVAGFQNNKGSVDGFISVISSDGSSIISSNYIGTTGIDVIFGIQFDRQGFPYITGTTTGTFPVINSPYNNANTNQNNGKQFIAKLQPDLSSFLYFANFGDPNANAPSLSISAFLVDRCGNAYVSGWGGSAVGGFTSAPITNLPRTADAYQRDTDGADFYFFVLKRDAESQLYGSFFGQVVGYPDHVDGGTSRFDANGTIYQSICSCRGSRGDPTRAIVGTPGSWSPSNRSNTCNLLAIKIAFNLAGVGAGPRSSINGVVRDTSGCVPLTVDFTDTLQLAQRYIWNFGDGSPDVNTANPNVSHTFNAVGLYRVRLVAIDSTSCNITDTAYVNMRVRADRAILGFNPVKLPPCTSLAYRFDNTSVASRAFGANAFRWDFGDGTTQIAGTGPVTHTYAAVGSYNVRLVLIDTSFCNELDSITQVVRISPNVKAQFETPAVGCVPYTAVFNNTSLAGQIFRWDFGDGTSSTATNPQHLYSNVGSYTVKLIAIDSATCNIIDSTSFTLSVRDNPTANYTYSPNPTQPNTPIVFTNGSSNATRYKWLFGDGDTLNTVRFDTTVRHLYNATGTYNACLVAYNDAGCSDTSCQSITVTIVPGFDVPNAFSPNGDGVNDKIFVRGFGIAKMVWRIYNRWGTVVYLGTNPSEGWDGRVNGKLQPQEVYHYTVELEFGNKEKAVKKGDITLLR